MKKRERRKITAAMFAGVLTLSMLTGCGGGANQTVGSVEAAQAGGAADNIGAGTVGSMTASDSGADAAAYRGKPEAGKIVVSGSSSVTTVMEKLKEAYIGKNPKMEIEIQQSDSSTGMADAVDGTCDIGMASRELRDSETEKGLTATVIAMDGIVVIVNNDSPVTELTSEQVKNIYTGDVVVWSNVLQ